MLCVGKVQIHHAIDTPSLARYFSVCALMSTQPHVLISTETYSM